MFLEERSGDPECQPKDWGPPPVVSASSCKRAYKGEDRMVVSVPRSSACPSFVAVCDGHCGPQAAKACVDAISAALPRILEGLGQVPCPSNYAGGNCLLLGLEQYAAQLREALHLLFTSIDREIGAAHPGGTSVTLAVLTGWLLTTANVGDSAAHLDNGMQAFPLTTCHRADANSEERQRLQACGASLLQARSPGPSLPDAGPGTILHVFPSGSPMGFRNSRSLGDAVGGPCLLPHPHVKQVLLPRSGARLIVASDGLWDAVPLEGVYRLSRGSGLEACAAGLAGAAWSRMSGAAPKAARDDVTVVALDMMPNCLVSFLDVVFEGQSHCTASCTFPGTASKTDRTAKRSSSLPLAEVLSRMGLEAPPREPSLPPAAARVLRPIQAVHVLADVDMAETLQDSARAPGLSRGRDSQEAFRTDSARSISGQEADLLRKSWQKMLRGEAVQCTAPSEEVGGRLCKPCAPKAMEEDLPVVESPSRSAVHRGPRHHHPPKGRGPGGPAWPAQCSA